jgi:nitrite reductase/ring-hydroxylating ferredoxin subunit
VSIAYVGTAARYLCHTRQVVWTPIADSNQLAPGCVVAIALPGGEVPGVEVPGGEMVAWCGRSGVLGAIPRFCPHLDHDLAAGYVSGDELVCAGHGWSFTVEGWARKRTELGRIDDKGSVPSYRMRRNEGRIEILDPRRVDHREPGMAS